MTPRKKTFVAATVAALVGVFLLLPACSNQGEGERCDTRSEDDCQDGLVCTAANLLNGAGNADRCCPPLADRAHATTAVCSLPATPGADAAPPGEAGSDAEPPEASTSDAPTDAADDAFDATPLTDASDDGG